MKKIAVWMLVAMLVVQQGYTQFSQAVKDSAVKLLQYPSADYSITLTFKPEDYVEPSAEPDLQKLTRQQLIDKKTGDYTDASIYNALSVKSWFEDKNQTEAEKYLTEAMQKYEQWINIEPNNTKPIDELLAMCLVAKSYDMANKVLAYAMPLFPKHLPLLQKAIFYEEFIAKDYPKSQQLINQALELDSLNLTTLYYQSSLHSLYHMEAMQQKKPFAPTEVPGLQAAALVHQPNNAGLRHLYHHHQLSYTYFSGVSRAMAAQTNSIKLFDYFTLSPAETAQLEAAAAWMQEQVALGGKNKAQLLSSLAVVECIKRNYTQALAHFEAAYRLTKATGDLEGQILCNMFMEAYPQVEKLLEEKVALANSMWDYGSLLKLYSDYTQKREAVPALLKKIQELSVDHPVKHQLLATGYLRTGQHHLLPPVLSLLGDTGQQDILIKLVAAIVKDQKATAAVYLNKLLYLQPDDEAGLAIKQLAAL